MTASITAGRALRYAGGSARGLLHQLVGHGPARLAQLPLPDALTRAPDVVATWHAMGLEEVLPLAAPAT